VRVLHGTAFAVLASHAIVMSRFWITPVWQGPDASPRPWMPGEPLGSTLAGKREPSRLRVRLCSGRGDQVSLGGAPHATDEMTDDQAGECANGQEGDRTALCDVAYIVGHLLYAFCGAFGGGGEPRPF